MESARLKDFALHKLDEFVDLPDAPREDWRARSTTARARAVAVELVQGTDWERVQLPVVFPTSGGGVILEFHEGPRELAIEITAYGQLEFLTREAGIVIDEGLTDRRSIQQLVNWVRQA